jgi:hypothetical protein
MKILVKRLDGSKKISKKSGSIVSFDLNFLSSLRFHVGV